MERCGGSGCPSMSDMQDQLEIGGVRTPAKLDAELLAELKAIPTLRHLQAEHLPLLEGIERVQLAANEILLSPGKGQYAYFVLIEGEVSISKVDGKNIILMHTQRAGDGFGEVPLLLGMRSPSSLCVAMEPTVGYSIPEQSFWKLMAASPETRELILTDCSRRYGTYQAMTLHREKLVALGTLAAGLMHELNNPGAAARRASSQLRENMSRLQQISLRMVRTPLEPEQLECIARLQEQVLHQQKPAVLSTLEQSDQEEALSEWLESVHVENAWRLAPTMVSAGITQDDIGCARDRFTEQTLSDTLNYLDALISSMQHVNTIEESIARVTDLVTAVKKYAYDDKNKQQMVDVRDSLLSTLTILNHKFRQKSIHVDRDLPPAESRISCVGAGLTQVWTNLLDNATDAAPENGEIHVRLWTEGGFVCVGIRDNGPGIPPEHWDHIFEPFYTTKEAGVGTGLGLDIAHRIVVGNFHGDIQFTTQPGNTEFIVRLPIEDPAKHAALGCSIANS